ncbi:MAG: DUF4097 family beta strand repeat protein [Lachnospiraceae bacterium]|nr:DUF4097 family beta strand repeat protein [Lachnospiraceae bacterium]
MKQVIKYAALIFALILAASIIGGCLTAGVAVAKRIVEKTEDNGDRNNSNHNGIWYRDEDGDVVFLGIRFGGSEEVMSGSEEFAASDIDSLELEGTSGEVIIETWDGEFIAVLYENISEDYGIYNDGGTLVIEKEGNYFFWEQAFKETPKIRVRVPEEKTLKKVKVDNGSGGVTITNVISDRLYVDSGSGGVNISEVEVKKSVFHSGSGSFTVKDSSLGETSMDSGSGFVNLEHVVAHNLVLDTGSGRVDVSGILTGNCMFESGSGSLNVVVYGEETEYNFRTDMGSGSFYLNGRKEDKEKQNVEYADADHLLVFDAGSGRVSLEFKEVPQSMAGNLEQDDVTEPKENFER